MRKLFRTHLFGWLRLTNAISKYLELRRATFESLKYSDTPEDNLRLLRELKRLNRGLTRLGKL